MKIQDIITEAPLPDDWNKEMFGKNTPIDQMIEYALSKAPTIGLGSSRVAFIVPYKGRDTILKVAKNVKGLAQNKFEAKMLSDPYVKKSGLAIPMIDYDVDNVAPRWIHMEKAEEVSLDEFKGYFGDVPFSLIRFISGGLPGINFNFDKLEDKALISFQKLIKKYDLPTADFTSIYNWGKYKGKIVIIDIGVNKDIYDKYYRL